MDRIVVRGGERLTGEVVISGSKNASLVLMAAALLAEGETRLSNVPRLRDVHAMLELRRARGARVDWGGAHTLAIDGAPVSNPDAPYDLVRKKRA